ncbi:MAG: cation diffusion facilitator family transporter, partial [Candidatus Aenigmatarchaeota archaeon]
MNYLSSFNINYLSIGVNFIIFVIQLIISLFTNSISLLSDAFDTLRDIFITLVVVWSLYLSKKPPDKMHPFGHGRIEEISGFGISIFLLAIGLNFLLESFTR